MDPIQLMMMGQGNEDFYRQMAMQQAMQGNVEGMQGNKLMLLPLARKFGDRLARKIRNMNTQQRARVLAALVSLQLGNKAEGEYKDMLEFSGVQDLIQMLSLSPEVIEHTDYSSKAQQIGNVGGEVRNKDKAAEMAKDMDLETMEEQEENPNKKSQKGVQVY